MGLDQFAYTRANQNQPEFIWRKHAKLQEFMEALYRLKNKVESAEGLNCGELELTAADISTLQTFVECRALPTSPGGFFFGHEYQDETAEEYRDQDLKFCAWAKQVLETRQQVFYSCWW